jgi:HSP20 family protein
MSHQLSRRLTDSITKTHHTAYPYDNPLFSMNPELAMATGTKLEIGVYTNRKTIRTCEQDTIQQRRFTMTSQMIPLSNFFDSVFAPATCSPHKASSAATLTPRTDILESECDFQLHLDIPGISRDDLSLELDGESLMIKAERTEAVDDKYRHLRRERGATVRFQRSFELGRSVDRDSISATLNDGVLTVVLPKTEQSVARKIEIK